MHKSLHEIEVPKEDVFHSIQIGIQRGKQVEKMATFKKSFGRKKKPQILTISAAGRIGIDDLISIIEKEFIKAELI